MALNPQTIEGWATNLETIFKAGFGLQNAVLAAAPQLMDATFAATKGMLEAYTTVAEQQQKILLGAWQRAVKSESSEPPSLVAPYRSNTAAPRVPPIGRLGTMQVLTMQVLARAAGPTMPPYSYVTASGRPTSLLCWTPTLRSSSTRRPAVPGVATWTATSCRSLTHRTSAPGS